LNADRIQRGKRVGDVAVQYKISSPEHAVCREKEGLAVWMGITTHCYGFIYRMRIQDSHVA